MKSGKFNLPRSNSGGILENDTPGIRKEIQKGETRRKYGGASRKVEIDSIGKRGTFMGKPFSGIPDADL